MVSKVAIEDRKRPCNCPWVGAALALLFASSSPAAGGDAGAKVVSCETLPEPPAGQVCVGQFSRPAGDGFCGHAADP